MENLLDKSIVAVSASDSTRSIEFVISFELNASYLFDFVDEFIDRNKLARPKIHRRGHKLIAMHDPIDALNAIVYIHETSRLVAVTPDFDRTALCVDGLDHLAANGSGSFLASAVPRAVRAIDVVESGGEGPQPALRPILLTKHLRDQFLPAVATLRHGGVSIGLAQRSNVGVLLKLSIVDASRRREEVSLDPRPIRSLNHVRVDENASKAFHPVSFDETHAAH